MAWPQLHDTENDLEDLRVDRIRGEKKTTKEKDRQLL
jgi:hypothetical protein